MYVVGYKVVSIGLLGKTPYEYDIAFFKLSLSLLAILMMKELYHGKFYFNLHKKNFMKCSLLLWPVILFASANILSPDIISDNAIVTETLIMVLIVNMITGFYEEVIMRGMLLGHMMEHWKNDERKILKSVLSTSVLFGLVHLGNLIKAGVISTLFQVCYATVLGLVFAAAYLRTKNLWACALLHGLVDVTGDLYSIYYAPGQEITNYFGTSIPLIIICTLIALIIALFELRKKGREEIMKLWSEGSF